MLVVVGTGRTQSYRGQPRANCLALKTRVCVMSSRDTIMTLPPVWKQFFGESTGSVMFAPMTQICYPSDTLKARS